MLTLLFALLVDVAHAAPSVLDGAALDLAGQATPMTVNAAAADPAGMLAQAVAQGAGAGDPSVSTAVRLLLFLTGMSFLPAMVIVMTPFVRFVVVLSLLRQALGLAQSPPNQVIVGLSLFLTLLVMQPVFERSWADGIAPFLDGQAQPEVAYEGAIAPFRGFMSANTRRDDMAAIMDIARLPRPESLADIPTPALVSAFVLSELETAFIIAIYVFIPFLVVDLVVSSILLGLGMMMLPPVMVSLPFKLLVFVLMDGWVLLVRDLVAGVAR
ncbi:MAG: flagellar type III secretion system pore protein FliP [Pseudomonadota bacterium]|nr:flagellar type III secretion system pore protein FliP [Pseudomonadota bacterium]